MKLIIILICLGLERYAQVGATFNRFHWFESYVRALRAWVIPETAWSGWFGIAVVILPILFVLGIIYFAVTSMFFSVIGFVLSVLILLYCLGPDDLYHQCHNYFSNVASDQTEQSQAFIKKFLCDAEMKDDAHVNRAVTRQIFIQANEHFFGVLFWFILLGPLGAVLYRVTVLIHRHKELPAFAHMQNQAVLLQDILDWIPVRLTGLIYALVGNFSATFACWMKYASKGFIATQSIITECSLAALGISKNAKSATVEENQAALELLDRALIVVLVLIAIFTLGAWIY